MHNLQIQYLFLVIGMPTNLHTLSFARPHIYKRVRVCWELGLCRKQNTDKMQIKLGKYFSFDCVKMAWKHAAIPYIHIHIIHPRYFFFFVLRKCSGARLWYGRFFTMTIPAENSVCQNNNSRNKCKHSFEWNLQTQVVLSDHPSMSRVGLGE